MNVHDASWTDFSIGVLQRKLDDLIEAARIQAELIAELSDKEVGLRLDSIPEAARGAFIFPFRKNGSNLPTGRMPGNAVRGDPAHWGADSMVMCLPTR